MRTTDFMRMSHAQAAMKASDIAYENEQLRQQLAEKDVEIEHLDRTKAEWKNTAKLLDEKLVATQAREAQLREALIGAHKALEAIGSEMTVGDRYTNAGQYLIDSLEPSREALAPLLDSSALEALIDKAGEVMRERCAEKMESQHTWITSVAASSTIRALPGVTLEDLQK